MTDVTKLLRATHHPECIPPPDPDDGSAQCRCELGALRDTVVWMSGASDFAPGTVAGDTYRKEVLPLVLGAGVVDAE